MLSTRVLGFKQQTSGETQQRRPPGRVFGKPSFGTGKNHGCGKGGAMARPGSAPTPQQKSPAFPATPATWLCTGGGKINVCGRRGPLLQTPSQ